LNCGVIGFFLQTSKCGVEQESLNYVAEIWNILQNLVEFNILIIQINSLSISYIKRIFIYVVMWKTVIAV